LRTSPSNVHIERVASPNIIQLTPVNAVMADSRSWNKPPDRNAVSLSTFLDPRSGYTSQGSSASNCQLWHKAADRYVIDLSSCLEHNQWKMNQDTSPEFSDASTDTPKEYDALEEISNYDMGEDDGRFLTRNLGRVCSPPLTSAWHLNSHVTY
jgi:hypothetical protein